MPDLLDAYKASYKALNGSLPAKEDFKTSSRNKEWVTGRVLDTAVARIENDGTISERNGQEEIFSIASITKTFSNDQLISLRQTLETSPEKFEEKFFDEFQKTPKPAVSTAPSHIEQMVARTKSGASEIY